MINVDVNVNGKVETFTVSRYAKLSDVLAMVAGNRKVKFTVNL